MGGFDAIGEACQSSFEMTRAVNGDATEDGSSAGEGLKLSPAGKGPYVANTCTNVRT